MSPFAHPSPDSIEARLLAFDNVLANSSASPRDVVLPAAILLFLRWLEHDEAEQAAVAIFEGREYPPSLPEELSWRVLRTKRGLELARYLDEIMLPTALVQTEGTSREKYLREVIQPKMQQEMAHPYGQAIRQLALAWPKLQALPEAVRDALVQLVDELPFERQEDRQQGEQLLAAMIRQGSTARSAFYTPQAAADLMIEVARPQPGERIYDPCFGSGSLLVTAARRLREESSRFPARQWEDIQRNSIFGVDHYPPAYFVGLVRVILAGIEHPGLELGDVLQRPRIRSLAREGFDCILAVPPWRKLERGYSSAGSFDIPTTSSEGLFLQHIAASLRPGGRAVVALPTSFLFSAGSEKRVRKMLLEDFRVDGVIGLPANVFKPYTNIESNLLVFSRSKPVESVRFLTCSALRGAGAKADAPEAQSPSQVASTFLLSKRAKDAWSTPVRALAAREWDLSPKRTGADELDQLLDEVQKASPNTQIAKLEDVADVWAGISYRKEDILDTSQSSAEGAIAESIAAAIHDLPDEQRDQLGNDGHFPMLIRAGDIQSRGLRRPKLALTNGILWGKAASKAVKVEDVLITVGGSIGKVGLTPDWAEGDLPSTNVSAIRPSSRGSVVSSHYLASLLASESYQNWLSGHARGSVIQHLSIRTLRNLPFPIPSLQIQERVASAVESTGADGLNELLRILTAEISDPVSIWLEKSVAADALSLANQANVPGKALIEIEALAKEFRTLRNELAHTRESGEPWLREWVFRTWEALTALQGISDIPDGMARLSILERGRSMLSTSFTSALVMGPGVSRAKKITEELLRALENEIEWILGDVKIIAILDESLIAAGDASTLTVQLMNLSGTALRDFVCESGDHKAILEIPYFAEGTSQDLLIEFVGLGEASGSRIDFTLTWRARRMDGKRVSDQIPLSVQVHAATAEERVLDDLGASPYITGTPVKRPEMFFGREGIIKTIVRNLTAGTHANVLLLEGNRRAGKSSILLQLEPFDVLPDWVVVRCDFQGAAGHATLPGIPTEQIYAHLAQKIAEAGDRYGYKFWVPSMPLYEAGKPYALEFRRAFAKAVKNLPAFEIFKEYLESVIQATAPRQLLLMLDEFDRIQEGIDSGVTSPQVPQNIRFILNNYPQVTSILTGSRRMTQMRKEYWSVLFGLGHRINVTAIPMEDARRLVTVPVEGRLVFPPQAVDKIVTMCACQPYLIQRLCSQIFDACARGKQRTVTLEQVEEAALELVTGLEHFEAFWEFAGDERARFILCIIHRLSQAADASPVTLPMIEDELQRCGVEFRRDELVGDELKKLIELELVAMAKEGQYRLEVPLLSLWISRNKDYEDQRERAVQESRNRV